MSANYSTTQMTSAAGLMIQASRMKPEKDSIEGLTERMSILFKAEERERREKDRTPSVRIPFSY